MKKGLLVWLTIVLWGVISGCSFFKIWDWDWMERESQYPIAEQECIDNDWEISIDEHWTPICIFFESEYCSLESIEKWDCEWIHQWWWEWITVVTDMCEEQWWSVEEWNEWWERQDVCYFDDKTFCYLEDFAAGKCKKWDMSYINDWYTYAEEACIDNNGQLSQTEDWEGICILSDEEFCYIRDVVDWWCDLLYQDMLDIQNMHEDERAYQEYISECYEQPMVTVCGQDWNPYANRCFMEKAGVEEETELAEVVDWECIYG